MGHAGRVPADAVLGQDSETADSARWSKKTVGEIARAYAGSGNDPDALADDAPEPVEGYLDGVSEDAIQRYHWCAEHFRWTPLEVDAQDEMVIDALMKFQRQLDYRAWAKRHDVIPDEDAEWFGPETPSYKDLGRD